MTKPARVTIVSSPDFIKLFEKARLRMLNPKRKWCKKGRHKICPANAHVGDVRRAGLYQCYPCWRATQKTWLKSTAGRSYMEAWRTSPYAKAWYKAYAKTPQGRAMVQASTHACRARRLGIEGRWKGADFLGLCAKYGNRCLCCGKRQPLTPDHVFPLSLGGPNVIGNIQPLCSFCNTSKHTGTTDYRKAPHPNCLKKHRPIKLKKICVRIPAPEVKAKEEDLFAGLF
jgi:5-methylcytosine-specific restriction endonuclease McrA